MGTRIESRTERKGAQVKENFFSIEEPPLVGLALAISLLYCPSRIAPSNWAGLNQPGSLWPLAIRG